MSYCAENMLAGAFLEVTRQMGAAVCNNYCTGTYGYI